MLTERLLSPAVCSLGLQESLVNHRVSGTVAELNGRVVGFMLAEVQLHPPDSVAAQFIEPQSMSVSSAGHAVAGDVSATDVYREMYASASALWVQDGYFTHAVHLTPGDRDTEEAWVNLGFGRKTVAAARETATPVAAARTDGIEVHVASPEDIEVISHLEHTNMLHHAAAPICWPLLPAPRRAIRDFLLGSLQGPENPHFVAYRDGKALGMDTFLKRGFYPPTVDAENSVYLLNGVVEPDVRGGGVGKALLAHSMDWARSEGIKWCVLHYASANPSGAPFWQAQGFVPCEYTMVRRIDERIAWANR